MEYQISHKNEIMPLAATWMNLEIIILSGVSQKDKDKNSNNRNKHAKLHTSP